MESLISELRQQYAASTASVAVSQAMLLHALNQTTRQVASRRASASQNIQTGPNNLLSRRVSDEPSANNNQYAPLDLSVKCQTSNQRSRSQAKLSRPRHASDLFNADETKSHAGNKNSDIASISNQLNQSKLITSSTSPISSGSTTSSASSSEPACFLRDSNNNQIEAPALAHELISSTNGRRRRRNRRPNQSDDKKRAGAKSHLCNFCGRSFSRSDMLTRHSRLHSGLKPYQCGKCYQVFSRSDHLSTHERTHTGEKPYQCQYCDYSACRRDMITRHMRTHSASQDGELEIRVNSRRRRRRRKTADKAKDSTSERIDEEDDDVSTSFEINVA